MRARRSQALGAILGVGLYLASHTATALPVEEWWRSGDGLDFSPAILRAQNAVAVGGTVELELGPRTYPCLSRIDIFRTVVIRGPGVRGQSVEAALTFTNTTGGILTHFTGTYGPDATASSYLTLERVRITGSGSGAGANLHGIQLQANASIDEVYVSAFSGSGIRIDATTPTADATGWWISHSTLTGNGGDGLYTNGTGSGGGVAIGLTVSSNTGYGVYDSTDHATIGNSYIGIYETGDTAGAFRSDASGAANTWTACMTAGGALSDIRGPDLIFGGVITLASTGSAAKYATGITLPTGATRAIAIETAAVDTAGNILTVQGGNGGAASAVAGGTGGTTTVRGATGGAGSGALAAGMGGNANFAGGTGGAGTAAVLGANGGGAGFTGGTAGASGGFGAGTGGEASIRGGFSSDPTKYGAVVIGGPTSAGGPAQTSAITLGNPTDNPRVHLNTNGTTADVTTYLQFNSGTGVAARNATVAYSGSANNAALSGSYGISWYAPGEGANALKFGASSGATGANSTLYGGGATANGDSSVVVGRAANAAGYANAIVIGRGATATAVNQAVLGSATYPIDELHVGPVSSANSLGQFVSVGAPAGSGANNLGRDLYLDAGASTGSGSGGEILFRSSLAGGAGSSLNALSTLGTFDSETGNLTLNRTGATLTTPALHVTGTGSNKALFDDEVNVAVSLQGYGGGALTLGGTDTGSIQLVDVPTLKAHANFANSGRTDRTGAVQTTDATQTTVLSFTLNASTTYWLSAFCAARETADANQAAYSFEARVIRSGAGAATLGTVVVPFSDETAAAWDATFTVSGNDVRISVTGAAATTINWACTLASQGVSGNG